jgi:hypothetical protein
VTDKTLYDENDILHCDICAEPIKRVIRKDGYESLEWSCACEGATPLEATL